MMHSHPVPLVIIIILVLTFIHPAVSFTAKSLVGDTGSYGISPFNPDFISYTEEREKGSLDVGRFETVTLGYFPPTVDFSHNRGSQVVYSIPSYSGEYLTAVSGSTSYPYVGSLVTGSSLPSCFDLRTQGKLTPVKDQGTCGSCWAFSTYASLESILLPGQTWDFSENNMKNTHGFDLASCQGGNALMATAYLTRWSGPITEQADPYKSVQVSGASMKFPNSAAIQHIKDVLFIPGRSNAGNNQNIKQALIQYGAVYSTIHWEENSYSSAYASYYYHGSSPSNHAITIVGWDDTYDRNKFQHKPSGNGAFIVKNSWGSMWGESGYFYISYYDTIIGLDNAVFCPGLPEDYSNIYQYDPLGWVTSYGDGTETAYFANVFTAQSNEQVAAVGFYIPATDSRYSVSVYRNVREMPVSGSPLGTTSGTISSPGYHTITLSEPVKVTKGEKFSVVVKLTTPGYQYPVALEYPYRGFSSRATAHSGESYISSSGTRWIDLTTVYADTNVCLKAYTIISGNLATVTLTPTPTSTAIVPTSTPIPVFSTGDIFPPSVSMTEPRAFTSVSPGQSVSVSWSATDNTGIAGVKVEYSGDDGLSWISAGTNLQASGSISLIIPKTSGSTLNIRVTARDVAGNEHSASQVCFVKKTAFSTSIPASVKPAITPSTRSTCSTVLAEFLEQNECSASSPLPKRSTILAEFLKQNGYSNPSPLF